MRPALRARWRLILLAALPFAVYARFIFLGDELSNADVFLAYRPAHTWLASGLRHLSVPLWNPNLLGGFPLAFSEYGWFSPLTWIPLALLGGHAGFYAAVACYVGIASLTAYALARRWGSTPGGALLAGLIYGHSLYVIGGAPLLNQGASYWALPALLWCVAAAFDGVTLAVPAAGAVTGLLLLGSHPQLAVVAGIPPAGYALWRAIAARRWRALALLALAAALGAALAAVRFLPTLPLVAASVRSAGLGLQASAIGSVSGQALLAGLFLPSLAVPRVISPQWSAYVGPLPLLLAAAALLAALRKRLPGGAPVSFLGLVALLGVVVALGSNTPVYGLLLNTPLLSYFREPSRFLLWTILAVALLAGSTVRPEVLATIRPPRVVRWLAVLAMLLLVAGYAGGYAALRMNERRLVPLGLERALANARNRDYPASFYVDGFGVAWRQVLRTANPVLPGTLIPLSALVVTVWWWNLKPGSRLRLAPGTLAVLSALPLLAYGQTRLPAIPAAVVRERPEVLDALQHQRSDVQDVAQRNDAPDNSVPSRVLAWLPLATDFEVRQNVEAAGGPADVASYRLLRQLMASNFGISLGVPQLDGYENLLTQQQAVLLSALGSERVSLDGDLSLNRLGLRDRRQQIGTRWPLAIAAGVGTVLSTERMQPLVWPGRAVRYMQKFVPARAGIPSLDAYVVRQPLPRAYVTPEWVLADSPEAAARILMKAGESQPGEDPLEPLPTTIQLVDGAPELQPRSARPAGPAVSRPGATRADPYSARIVRYEERRVEIETDADSDALLVLLDASAPGWTATVTGRPAPIYLANVAFRAVPIPAGRQLVVFSYTPPSWHAGLAVTFASALLLLAWTGWALLAGMRHLEAPETVDTPDQAEEVLPEPAEALAA